MGISPARVRHAKQKERRKGVRTLFSVYSETVTGTETYTITESGNPANGTYNRTTVGGGSYTRTDTGPGATLPSNSGSTNYNLTETADARAGQLSQTGTDYDRYSYLLERFNNVANTGGGNDPGNMNFSPVGQPFVDPGAAGGAWAPKTSPGVTVPSLPEGTVWVHQVSARSNICGAQSATLLPHRVISICYADGRVETYSFDGLWHHNHPLDQQRIDGLTIGWVEPGITGADIQNALRVLRATHEGANFNLLTNSCQTAGAQLISEARRQAAIRQGQPPPVRSSPPPETINQRRNRERQESPYYRPGGGI